MNRWDVLAAICDRLAAGLLDRTGSPPAAIPSWEILIEASSHQLVTPALAWSMRGADCPPDIHDYLDAVLTLNRSRNQTILATLSRVTGVLNGLGIEPVLLKGAAHLATGLYPDPGVRIVGDIDLLVPAEGAADAAAMLADIGFDRAGPTPLVAVAMHHLPTLCERETGVALELHTEVVVKSHAAFLPVPWFLAGTEPLALGGLRCRVPDATRAVAHTIVHSELHHGGHRYSTVRLRPLLDLAMLRARYDYDVDWQGLQAVFDRNRAGDVLTGFLACAEALFGQPMPAALRRPHPDAVERLRQAVERPETARRPRLADLIAAYRTRVRTKPQVLVNLLSPRLWPLRLRTVRDILRPSKW